MRLVVNSPISSIFALLVSSISDLSFEVNAFSRASISSILSTRTLHQVILSLCVIVIVENFEMCGLLIDRSILLLLLFVGSLIVAHRR